MQDRNNAAVFLIILAVFTPLSLISLLTESTGTTDIGDYAGVAKFFAGRLHSNIRASHSYFYGLLHHPLISLTQNFLALKIMNLLYLFLIILSVYLASGKNRKTLLLLLFSPVIWYMGPWIGPIGVSALSFFWAYFFMKKYDLTDNPKFLIISGLLIGFAVGFWDAASFFVLILAASFLYNKKTAHSALFFLFALIGFLPKLLVDRLLFGSFLVGVLRYSANTFGFILFGEKTGELSFDLINMIPAIILIAATPVYKLFLRDKLSQAKKQTVFICLSLLLILATYSQIRYLLIISPILLLETSPQLSRFQLRWYLFASLFLIPFIIAPYLIQVNSSTNIDSFENLLKNAGNIQIDNSEKILQSDLDKISEEFPGETFIIGNKPDNYILLFLKYWRNDIRVVSIQDYLLYLAGDEDLFNFTYNPKSNIQNRREIWVAGGIRKNSNDRTDYRRIRYALVPISEGSIALEGFVLKESYNQLHLFEKLGP